MTAHPTPLPLHAPWWHAPEWSHASDARHDDRLGAWILSRHADVAAALRDPRLAMPGTQRPREAAHAQLHESVAASLTPAQLAAWRPRFEDDAARLVASLPVGQPVDLVELVAAPWSLAVALTLSGVPPRLAGDCDMLARTLFLEAAYSTDGVPTASMQRCAADLARHLLQDPFDRSANPDVQRFVAVSQTLPSLIAAAWCVLLQHPAESSRLHDGTVPRGAAIAELLRLGGPARAVFRVALEDTDLGSARLRAGDRVVLLLAAANRDPLRYPDPDCLDLSRPSEGQLALGAGTHRCAGASLVQLALSIMTSALLDGTRDVQLTEDAVSRIEWIDGFAMRALRTLPVVVWRHSGHGGQ